MKVCISCKKFEVKSFNSYKAHFGLCEKGKSLLNEDFSYVAGNFNEVSRFLKKKILLKECN